MYCIGNTITIYEEDKSITVPWCVYVTLDLFFKDFIPMPIWIKLEFLELRTYLRSRYRFLISSMFLFSVIIGYFNIYHFIVVLVGYFILIIKSLVWKLVWRYSLPSELPRADSFLVSHLISKKSYFLLTLFFSLTLHPHITSFLKVCSNISSSNSFKYFCLFFRKN